MDRVRRENAVREMVGEVRSVVEHTERPGEWRVRIAHVLHATAGLPVSATAAFCAWLETEEMERDQLNGVTAAALHAIGMSLGPALRIEAMMQAVHSAQTRAHDARPPTRDVFLAIICNRCGATNSGACTCGGRKRTFV